MKNKDLIHYLNSGVKVMFEDESSLILTTINSSFIIDRANPPTPLLYPLSCLTETINHEGVDEIPLVELAKIEGAYKGEEYEIVDSVLIWRSENNTNYCFAYSFNYKSFITRFENNNEHCYNQLLLFQYLFSRRINVFGIDAIDPRTLDVNPYKI
jgi:hypothetical protein